MNMSRRRVLLATAGLFASAVPAFAQQDAVTRGVLRQLERQGFDVLQVNRTLLGRVQILARRDNLMRELVFDPRNGAILRDFVSGDDGDRDYPDIGDYDDDYDDDDDDDDDDDGDDDDDEDDDEDNDDDDDDDDDD